MENVYFAEDIPFMELVFCIEEGKLCILLKSLSTNINADIVIREIMERKNMFKFCSKLCEDISNIFDFENNESEILSKINKLKNEISILQFTYGFTGEYNYKNYHININELGIKSIIDSNVKETLEKYLEENKENIHTFLDCIFND